MAEEAFAFDVIATEFGLDSCSTTNLCFDESLFTPGAIEKLVGSEVEGRGGRSEITKKGSVSMITKGDNVKRNTLVIENVACVSSSSKNLISILQWGEERNEDVELRCKGRCSNFYWDDYTKHRHIIHHPECKTPLLEVEIEDKRGS